VDETDIGKVKPGQETTFRVDTYPNKAFQGPINTIYPNPVVKDNITYYLASLLIPSDDAALLRPEMTAYSKIIINKKEDILLIPNSGLKLEKDKQVAYKVTGKDKVEKMNIKPGIRGEDETEVISGLNEGDEVATKIILPVSKDTKASKRPH
jgi:multidrug efflux pump subunit AcrA (membrane-fusion protein)